MKKALLLIGMLLIGMFLSVGALAQGEQAFLQLNNMEGSATEASHDKWIDVSSFSMVTEPGAPKTLTFTHDAEDMAASKLESYFTKGYRISNGKLEMCASVTGKMTALNCIEFENLRVEATKTCTDAATGRSVQKVTLRAESVTWTESDSTPDPYSNGYFLKIGDLEGNSDTTGYEGWIKVLAYEETGTEGRSDGVFTFRHSVDRTTPALQENCLNRTWIRGGELAARKPIGRVEYAANQAVFDGLQILKTEVRGEATTDDGMRFVENVKVRYNTENWTITPNLFSSPKKGNYFISLDDIEGEAADPAHKGWIDVTSFTAGRMYDPATKKREVPNGTITFKHAVDVATPALRAALQAGTGIENGRLDVCKTVDGQRIVADQDAFSAKVIGTKTTLEEQPNGDLILMEEVALRCGREEWAVVQGAADPAGKEIYLKIGIEGESEDSKHDKWIELLSYSVKDANTYVFCHTVDLATPEIVDACRRGHKITEGYLNVCEIIAGKSTVVEEVRFEDFWIVQTEVRSEVTEDGTPRVVEEFTIVCESGAQSVIPPKPPEPPKTGDSTPIPLYLLLAIAAGAGLCVLKRNSKRN